MEIVTRRAHGKIPDHQWNVLCDLPTHSKEFSRSEFEVPMVEILGAYYRFTELRSYSIDFVFEMYTRVGSLYRLLSWLLTVSIRSEQTLYLS